MPKYAFLHHRYFFLVLKHECLIAFKIKTAIPFEIHDKFVVSAYQSLYAQIIVEKIIDFLLTNSIVLKFSRFGYLCYASQLFNLI